MCRKPFVTGFGISVDPGRFIGVFGFFSINFSMTEPSIEPESREESAGERKDETMLLCPFKSGSAIQRFAAGFWQGQNSANDENGLGSKATIHAGIRRKAFCLLREINCRTCNAKKQDQKPLYYQ